MHSWLQTNIQSLMRIDTAPLAIKLWRGLRMTMMTLMEKQAQINTIWMNRECTHPIHRWAWLALFCAPLYGSLFLLRPCQTHLINEAVPLGFPAPYHFTDGLGLLRELMGVHLLCLQHSSVHFFPLHLLFPPTERRLPGNHLINETAQPPVVRAERVSLVVQHLWSCGGERGALWKCLLFTQAKHLNA